jgi:hypothetical protein
MAAKNEKASGAGEVRLRDRDGNETTATSPATINSLVYGQGYTIVGDESVPEAAQRVANAEPAPEKRVPGPIQPQTQ